MDATLSLCTAILVGQALHQTTKQKSLSYKALHGAWQKLSTFDHAAQQLQHCI